MGIYLERYKYLYIHKNIMTTVHVSARVDKTILEDARRYSISISEALRESLLSRIRNAKRERLQKNVKKLSGAFSKIGIQSIVKDIRKTRESR